MTSVRVSMHIQRLQCEPVAGLQGKAEVCEVPKGAQRLIRGSWQVCQPALWQFEDPHTLHWCSLCFMFMKNCPLTLPIMSKNTFLSFVSLKLKNCLLQRQNEISLESVSLVKYRPTYKVLFQQCVVSVVVSNILHSCALVSASMVETIKEIK